jgi:hypothetical protein
VVQCEKYLKHVEGYIEALVNTEEGLAMGKLILNSWVISKFQAFEHLQIEQLGRVKLVVGKK